MSTIIEMDMPVDKKWVEFFAKSGQCPQLLKLVEHVLSIPASNASAERVFSVMNNLNWSDSRNRMRIELVKSELQIKTNLSMSCIQLYDCILTNKGLLSAARSEKKYNFKLTKLR